MVLSPKVEKDRITLWSSNFKELQSQREIQQISLIIQNDNFVTFQAISEAK